MIPPLQQPDEAHVDSAAGWCELGAFAEAQAELDKVNPDMREHPLVLQVRWQLCAGLKRREEAMELADKMVDCFPEWPNGWNCKAATLAEMDRVQEALWTVRVAAARFFPRLRSACGRAHRR